MSISPTRSSILATCSTYFPLQRADWLYMGVPPLYDIRALDHLMWALYACTSDICYLDRSIQALRDALGRVNGLAETVRLLHCLGDNLRARFEYTRDVRHLHAALAAFRYATEHSQDDYTALPTLVYGLASSLHERFNHLGDLEGVDTVLSHVHRALRLESIEGHDQALLLTALGNLSHIRFQRFGTYEDINAAISAYQQLVDAVPVPHPQQAMWLTSLGAALSSRFQLTGELRDIDAAIRTHRRAVEVTFHGKKDSMCLHNLATALGRRFQRTGELADSHASVSMLHEVVDLTPEGHPEKPKYLSNLGAALSDRYQHTGDSDDIDASITVHRRAVDLTPDGHPGLPARLTLLGNALSSRSERYSELKDIEAAIAAQRRAIELTPDGHPEKFLSLHSLGNSLIMRYYRLGELADLETAVQVHRRGVELVPEGHAKNPTCLIALGSSLGTRFQFLSNLEDLEECITVYQRAIELTPEDRPEIPGYLSSMGVFLRHRFLRVGDLKDIDESVAKHKRAVALTRHGHPFMALRLNNLGDALVSRFRRMAAVEDVENAIATYRRAIDITPEHHPDMPGLLFDLGLSLEQFHELNPSIPTLNEAIQAYSSAMMKTSGHISVRLEAALRYSSLISQHGTSSALLCAYSHVMSILPQIVWLGYSVNRRFDITSNIRDIVGAAVSAAISAEALTEAVEWLESGRSFIWSQVASLRTPVNELEQSCPDLAESLRRIRSQLQQSWHTSATHSMADSRLGNHATNALIVDPDTAGTRHRTLVIEYEQVVAQIRACAGFEDFLMPKDLPSLISSLDLVNEYIIFVNVHPNRCDALVISQGGSVGIVPLPELTMDLAVKLSSQWTERLVHCMGRERAMIPHYGVHDDTDHISRLLGIMWKCIVHLVAQFLEITQDIPKSLPHIIWCPTGPLSQLPLHAAGVYGPTPGPRTCDFVVSSYTPSVTAYIRASEGIVKPSPAPSVLIVTQPATPHRSPLPSTVTEARLLQKVLLDHRINAELCEHEKATVKTVRGAIDRHHWVHLACHGSQHPDATQSAFHLYDGPLSLLDLMRTSSDTTELAFLSACQTATGDQQNTEESAHLAAGMLAVGFKGVVATMWSIQDTDAPVIVEAFYKELLRMRLNSGSFFQRCNTSAKTAWWRNVGFEGHWCSVCTP